jgi:hypothetical protein
MAGTFQAILWAGSACAILDGLAASIQFGLIGIKPVRVWQGVASGLLGERAFHKGWLSGSLGLLLHSLIAFTVAALFVGASRRIPFLAQAYWISGPLYGIAVFLVMNLVVVPLSARPKRQASSQAVVVQLMIHIFFVGLPIALVANRFAFLG